MESVIESPSIAHPCLFYTPLVPNADFSGRTTIFATLWEAIARSFSQHSGAKLTFAMQPPLRCGKRLQGLFFNALVPNADFSGRTTIFATPWGAIARSFFQPSGAKVPFAMQSPVKLL